jgi:hypothetical protein
MRLTFKTETAWLLLTQCPFSNEHLENVLQDTKNRLNMDPVSSDRSPLEVEEAVELLYI